MGRHLSLLIAFCAALAPASAQDFYDRGTLRTLELTFTQPDWQDQLRDNKAAGLQVYLAGELTVDGVTYPNVGVRYKGNSSYWLRQGGQKPPFHIDMKALGTDQDHLGHHKIILNNQWSDGSLMREVVAYQVLNQFVPSARANFIKLVINGDNYGIYTNVEHVGGKFTKRWWGNEGGFRYKAVPPDTWNDTLKTPPPPGDLALQDLSFNLNRAQRAYELKNNDGDPNAHLDVLDAIDVLNNTLSANMLPTLDPLFDTDTAIRHLALNNALASLDSYYDSGRNYYLYSESVHGRIQIIPWDFNMAFGGYGRAPSDLSPTKGAGDSTRPLLSNLVEGGVLRQEYLAHYANLLPAIDPAVLHAEIDALEALIDAEVALDGRLNLTYSGWKSGISQLKSYITNRHSFLSTHNVLDIERPSFTATGHEPAQPAAGGTVQFWADVNNPNDPVERVWVHTRVAGAFTAIEMFDDGLNGDGAAGDGRFGVSVPVTASFGQSTEFYFSSKVTNSNGMAFAPSKAAFEPMSFDTAWSGSSSDVVLNEFVARNNNGPVDEAGQAEDWIELYNRGANVIDLSGMYMTDDLEQPTKWAIPAGTTLAPSGTLHIWADEDLLDGPYHADFKLSAAGEEVALIDVDGSTVLDYVSFGLQEPDVATARLVDGGELWVTTPDTTAFARNDLTCGARRFDALDPLRNAGTMAMSGTPSIGGSVNMAITGFAPGQGFDFVIGAQPVTVDDPLSGLTLLVEQRLDQTRIFADATGSANFPVPIPSQANLIGLTVYAQAGTRAATPAATNALQIVICP